MVEALSRAREAGLDVVEVAPKGVPPVCRLMDYGKWKYDQKKKEHRAKVKQHNVVLKEVRLRPKTDEHDRMFKMKQARQFLEKGSKVQFTMLFRGREMVHIDLAQKKFQDIAEQLQDVCKVELAPRQQGRRMTMVLSPDSTKDTKDTKDTKSSE
jgi:translation initiation factor IF-3